MKVLTFSIKTAIISVVIFVAIITLGILLVFGGAQNNEARSPEIEIVLP